jgi:RNA polymerase sigma-70 factor (ECF subfamily)
VLPPDRPPRARPASAAELDELTIARAQRGDASARRALVERYQRPVFALLSRMLRGRESRALVEDMAQETFLRVFRALPTYKRNGSARLSTWILTIASNRAIDELRRKRPRLPSDAPNLERIAAASHSAQEEIEGRALARVLQHAIDNLTPEYRAAFLLRVFHDMKYSEISTALSVDLGTVKSRISRARTALRRALEEVYDGF